MRFSQIAICLLVTLTLFTGSLSAAEKQTAAGDNIFGGKTVSVILKTVHPDYGLAEDILEKVQIWIGERGGVAVQTGGSLTIEVTLDFYDGSEAPTIDVAKLKVSRWTKGECPIATLGMVLKKGGVAIAKTSSYGAQNVWSPCSYNDNWGVRGITEGRLWPEDLADRLKK